MTTLVELGPYQAWRANRVCAALGTIAVRCSKPRLTRPEAQALAAELRIIAAEVADLFICPVCKNPEVCACAECPTGSLTAQPVPH